MGRGTGYNHIFNFKILIKRNINSREMDGLHLFFLVHFDFSLPCCAALENDP